MKIVLYDDYQVGLLNDGNVVDVSGVVPRGGTPQLTIEGLIENFQSLKGALERELDWGRRVPLSNVRLRAPVPRPGKRRWTSASGTPISSTATGAAGSERR